MHQHHHRVFPWWAGYLLVNPLRKFLQNPDKILGPYLKSGMSVLEIGPGMGFFSIPMARAVGRDGRIVCVDLQKKMLEALERRASKAGVKERIEARLCTKDSYGISDLAGKIDLGVLIAIVHEVPDASLLWTEVARTLKPDGRVLFSEPKGPVPDAEFKKSIALAQKAGFDPVTYPEISGNRSVVLRKVP